MKNLQVKTESLTWRKEAAGERVKGNLPQSFNLLCTWNSGSRENQPLIHGSWVLSCWINASFYTYNLPCMVLHLEWTGEYRDSSVSAQQSSAPKSQKKVAIHKTQGDRNNPMRTEGMLRDYIIVISWEVGEIEEPTGQGISLSSFSFSSSPHFLFVPKSSWCHPPITEQVRPQQWWVGEPVMGLVWNVKSCQEEAGALSGHPASGQFLSPWPQCPLFSSIPRLPLQRLHSGESHPHGHGWLDSGGPWDSTISGSLQSEENPRWGQEVNTRDNNANS